MLTTTDVEFGRAFLSGHSTQALGLGLQGKEYAMTTMFERYGGFASVSKIIMSFYDKVLDSDIAGPYFDDVDMKSLIDHQTKFIAQVMGGPAEYSNEVLQNVHAKHRIDREAYNEVTMLLKDTLQEFDVAPADINQVMAEIASRSSYIISA